MRDALVCAALRTPIGRLRGGLASVRPDDLAGDLIATLVARAGIDPLEIDEVYLGCANQAGEDNRNVARMAALVGGLPFEVPGVTVNRLCASGLEAVAQAARAVRLGEQELCVAGGVESMSRAPWSMPKPEVGYPIGGLTAYDTSLGWRYPNPRLEARFPLEQMGETAENLAERYEISREDQDRFAAASHAKALAAQAAGLFDDELVQVEVPQRKGPPRQVSADEGPRADSSLETLSRLRPVFRAGGSVTAGNSSTLNDGAAALLIASPEKAKALGLTPLARVVGAASAGVDPQVMGIGPVPATQKLLARVGVPLEAIERVELNEAFAAQSLAVIRALGLDPERVNPQGGAIALGHPLGCSGARISATLLHGMRRAGERYGLATLCVGVGQGLAVLFEAVD